MLDTTSGPRLVSMCCCVVQLTSSYACDRPYSIDLDSGWLFLMLPLTQIHIPSAVCGWKHFLCHFFKIWSLVFFWIWQLNIRELVFTEVIVRFWLPGWVRRLQGPAETKPPIEALHFSWSIDQVLFLSGCERLQDVLAAAHTRKVI